MHGCATPRYPVCLVVFYIWYNYSVLTASQQYKHQSSGAPEKTPAEGFVNYKNKKNRDSSKSLFRHVLIALSSQVLESKINICKFSWVPPVHTTCSKQILDSVCLVVDAKLCHSLLCFFSLCCAVWEVTPVSCLLSDSHLSTTQLQGREERTNGETVSKMLFHHLQSRVGKLQPTGRIESM